MTFTDDDLKKLKEWANGADGCLSEDPPCWHQEVKALLARLEAAEGVCDVVNDPKAIYVSSWLGKALKTWRKSKGE